MEEAPLIYYIGVVNSIELRTCNKCGDKKPLDDFPIVQASRYPDRVYRRHLCRFCYYLEHGQYQKKYVAEGRYAGRYTGRYKGRYKGRYDGRYKQKRKEALERYRLRHPSSDTWKVLKLDIAYMAKKRDRRKKSYEQESADRKLGQNMAKWFVADSKNNDRNRKRENNLTVGFVKEMISRGCSYCGENEIRIGLDRIDNSIGHLVTNVVAACCRCNIIRGDMPYQAWLNIVPAVRQTREAGLFGSWLPPIARKRQVENKGEKLQAGA